MAGIYDQPSREPAQMGESEGSASRGMRDRIAEAVGKRSPIQRTLLDISNGANVVLKRLSTP
jgi:hypothetical protein